MRNAQESLSDTAVREIATEVLWQEGREIPDRFRTIHEVSGAVRLAGAKHVNLLAMRDQIGQEMGGVVRDLIYSLVGERLECCSCDPLPEPPSDTCTIHGV